MSKLHFGWIVAVAVMLAGCADGEPSTGTEPPPTVEPGDVPADYLPRTPSASADIARMRIDDLDSDTRLAVMSLQGIVNRDKAVIYTHGGDHLDEWIVDLYKQKGYIRSERVYTDAMQLIREYADRTRGVVIFDPDKPYTRNFAVNVAGVEDCIVVAPAMADQVRELIPSPVTIDLRDHDFEDELQAWDWYFENIFPRQNHNVLALGQPGKVMYEMFYDYVVQFKLPLFWLPWPSDGDYSAGAENSVRKLLSLTPDNIPILGFWPAEDGTGWTEAAGVKLGGQYGKYTIVNTYAGNYSYHSGVDTGTTKYVQTKPRSVSGPTYDPTKKYVALIMIESGDAPCYFTYGAFNKNQWNQPERGQVPVSYGITPSLRVLAPAVLKEIYDTQTENDYFFMSISGAGYCYPLDGFGDKAQNREQCITDYFRGTTKKNLDMMDLDMMGMTSVSYRTWDTNDIAFVNRYIATIPGLRSVIADMHRIGDYTAANAHGMLDNDVSVHHTVTFWSQAGFDPDDTALDEAAVDYLIKEIETYGDGQFIQAMFYSWDYGPRRLKMLMDRLEPEGYVFVRLNDFDRLWRDASAL